MSERSNEEFIREMRLFLAAMERMEENAPVPVRKPYQDMEALMKFRTKTGVTQKQIADVLGMTKQGWSKKEKSCRQWIEAGRPEQESYRDDIHLTAEQWFQIRVLANEDYQDEETLFADGWGWMVRLLRGAVQKDAVLTKEMLQCIGEARLPALQRTWKVALPMMKNDGVEHFREEDMLQDLRRKMVNAIDRVMVERLEDDNGLEELWEAAKKDAQFELKRKVYQKELQEEVSAFCSKEALARDMALRTRVMPLLDARPMPEVGEEELKAVELTCFEDLIVRKIDFELRASARAAAVQLRQKYEQKSSGIDKNFESTFGQLKLE